MCKYPFEKEIHLLTSLLFGPFFAKHVELFLERCFCYRWELGGVEYRCYGGGSLETDGIAAGDQGPTRRLLLNRVCMVCRKMGRFCDAIFKRL